VVAQARLREEGIHDLQFRGSGSGEIPVGCLIGGIRGRCGDEGALLRGKPQGFRRDLRGLESQRGGVQGLHEIGAIDAGLLEEGLGLLVVQVEGKAESIVALGQKVVGIAVDVLGFRGQLVGAPMGLAQPPDEPLARPVGGQFEHEPFVSQQVGAVSRGVGGVEPGLIREGEAMAGQEAAQRGDYGAFREGAREQKRSFRSDHVLQEFADDIDVGDERIRVGAIQIQIPDIGAALQQRLQGLFRRRRGGGRVHHKSRPEEFQRVHQVGGGAVGRAAGLAFAGGRGQSAKL